MRNILNLFRAPEAKASRAARLVAIESGGRARWTPRDYAALAREGYMSNAIVHRAVKLVAESAASVTWLAYEGDTAREPHPVTALLARPNPRQETAAFIEALCAHLLLAGNAYVEAVTLDGAVRELHALRPDRMRVVPGADGWPEAYEYAVGGRTLRFEQNASGSGSFVPPILHLAQFHPLDDHYGLSSIEPAAVAIDTHNAGSKWNKSLLDNAARPCGALVYSSGEGAILSDNQFERLKRELEQQYQGAQNAGRPLLLEGGLDWQPMSLSPKELSLLECPGFALTLLHALWSGHEIGINGFATLSGLLIAYFGARFGVLGVYVSGRSREKQACSTGQPAPSVVGAVVKALVNKK